MPGAVQPAFLYPRSSHKDFRPLGHLDGRTKAARILKSTRDALIRHCGGSPSAVQLGVIDRCCWLTLELSMLDGKIAAGSDSGFDNDQYLAWQGHLTRNLVKLGVEPPAVKEPSLAEVLKAERVA
jgi:hypothetical protein